MALHLAIDGKTNEGFKEKNAAANLCDPPFKVKMKPITSSRHMKHCCMILAPPSPTPTNSTCR